MTYSGSGLQGTVGMLTGIEPRAEGRQVMGTPALRGSPVLCCAGSGCQAEKEQFYTPVTTRCQ